MLATGARARDLEPPGQTLAQTLRDEQWRRAERHDLQRTPLAGIFIPHAFDGFRLAGELLDFIEDQQRARLASIRGLKPCGFPLLLEPGGDPAAWARGRR